MDIPVARPPWTQVGRLLESMCRKAIYTFGLLEGVDRLAIALSGGKDSLTLLFLLKAILGRGAPDIPLSAIYVKGAFSCGPGISEGYLKVICEELGVPLLTASSSQKLETLSCYPCSRERRRLIFDTAKKEGINTIAFGHHRDDSIQTLLMNLLHKGEFAGNLAKVPMQQYGVTIIRPLIYVPEAKIRTFAEHYGFTRITCQCPVGQQSMRKQTEMLLQEMEKSFPNIRENLSHACLKYGSQKALEP